MTSWTYGSATKDAGQMAETAQITISDVHDFASTYGEFLPTGNDPTSGQLGSIRFGIGTRGAAASLPASLPA